MADIIEAKITSGKRYADPFNEIEVDVEFRDPQGNVLRVPAFWAGGQEWRARYLPLSPGRHHYRWICSDESDAQLNGTAGTLMVELSLDTGALKRGRRLRVAENKRYLEFTDGTPFFWLGDTWWLGLVQRKGWGLPEFKQLAQDRIAKGFTLIQIVAGLYPDLPPYDPRGFNEAGYPWEPEYARINPAYFDAADRRIEALVDAGLVPCIVAAWGYHLPSMGIERMKQHWRYLIARWGAYPVIWCVAGEATMPYYLSQQREADAAFQRHGWTEIARYVRTADPYHNPVTIHPAATDRKDVEDEAVLDIEMFGTGHGDWSSVPYHLDTVTRTYRRTPTLPIVDTEVCYEGHMQSNWQNVQRFMFWTCLLNGVAGYTYGAGGIWQMNTRLQPHGPSPQGWTYENTPWDEAAQLPGARQVGLGKALLAKYPWWCLQPMPDSVEPRWTPDNYFLPYAAGTAGQVRFVYIPGRIYQASGPLLKDLEQGSQYHACYWDPIKGTEYDLGVVVVGPDGTWQAPNVPLIQDWLLILEHQA
jgi:hypothetical protein